MRGHSMLYSKNWSSQAHYPPQISVARRYAFQQDSSADDADSDKIADNSTTASVVARRPT
jgi:hypothetical protein